MLFAVACTAPNPAFGDGSAEGTGASSSTSAPGSTLDASSAPMPTATESNTSPGDDNDSSGQEEHGTEEGTTDAVRPDAGSECKVGGAEIDAALRRDEKRTNPCAIQVPAQGIIIELEPDIMVIETCASCLQCADGAGGPIATLEVSGFAIPETLALGECVDVMVDRHNTDECGLRSFAISRYQSEIGQWEPAVLAAHDSVDIAPHPASPGGLLVPLFERMCEGLGCEESGRYSLDFTNERYVPNDEPVMVPLFGRTELFDLKVRAAAVDEDCKTQVAWLAYLTP